MIIKEVLTKSDLVEELIKRTEEDTLDELGWIHQIGRYNYCGKIAGQEITVVATFKEFCNCNDKAYTLIIDAARVPTMGFSLTFRQWWKLTRAIKKSIVRRQQRREQQDLKNAIDAVKKGTDDN